MKRFKLRKGMRVVYERKKGKSVVVEVLVGVGSNFEGRRNNGVSHFIEHMLFEGTKKRGSSREIANEIERVGGEMNAYTGNERTCFYIKVLGKHFELALDVLADIIQNPLFRDKDIEKERKIVLKEVDLINDQPRSYQWVLWQGLLGMRPTYGRKEIIKRLKRKEIIGYYGDFYRPGNMIISVVGEVKDLKRKLEEKFVFKEIKKIKKGKEKIKKIKKGKEKKIKKKIANSYLVWGYETVPRGSRDSYVLDVMEGVLGRGQSGWLFNEIRAKRGLAYEVGVENQMDKDYGFFACYLSTDRGKVEEARKAVLEVVERLKGISAKELKEAKEFVEGNFYLESEDTAKLADILGFWEQVGRADLVKDYIGRIKKVSKEDIRRVVGKYFKKGRTVLIEGE